MRIKPMRIALEMLARLVGICMAATLATSTTWAADIQLLTELWVPYVNPTKPSGAEGVAVDLVGAILDSAGISLEPTIQPWPRTYKMALHSKNVLVFSMVKIPERDKLFTWIAPLIVSEPSVLVYAKNERLPKPQNVEDLKKYKICIMPGTPFYLKLQTLGFEPNKNLLEFQPMFPDPLSSQDNELKLISHDCQFIVTGWVELMAHFRRRGVKDPETQFAFYDAPDAIFGTNMHAWLVASKEFDADALHAIKAGYQSVLKSGELHSICRARHGFDEETCQMLEPQ